MVSTLVRKLFFNVGKCGRTLYIKVGVINDDAGVTLANTIYNIKTRYEKTISYNHYQYNYLYSCLYMDVNMKRILVIAMLMFTVLACSTGPSQAEFDELEKNQLSLAENQQNLLEGANLLLEAIELLGERQDDSDQDLLTLEESILQVEENRKEGQRGIWTELNNKPKLVDFIVTYKVSWSDSDEGEPRGKIEYLVGDETKSYVHHLESQCYEDAVIGAPLPLSCR